MKLPLGKRRTVPSMNDDVLEYQIRGMFMKATTIRIHDDMLGRIDGLAKELSRSRSWVITQAIDRF